MITVNQIETAGFVLPFHLLLQEDHITILYFILPIVLAWKKNGLPYQCIHYNNTNVFV